ncbi:MAG: ATP-binding cassette domain-containing protein [Fibrobacteraceae bacterium]|nr:ATP-binding cassette domain-containing protein [Fibrobacteraceae bacterium]
MIYATLDSLLEKFPQIQMIGAVGSGKSRVLREFAEKHEKVALSSTEIQRRIQRALAPFWQQRFISLRDDDAPRVRDLLLKPKFFLNSEHYVEDDPFAPTDPDRLESALQMANLPETVLKVKLLSLSNGELRRILLARLWMESPDYILFDDLYGGLDPEYRVRLAIAVMKMAETGVKMVIGLQRKEELFPKIPAFVYENGVFSEYTGELPKEMPMDTPAEKKLMTYAVEILNKPESTGEVLFDLKHVHVRYGSTNVLNDLTWQVKKGEHWVVMGPNGAGKSTLLAILSADHPQMYGNDITLFGKKPGNGLNIWEHKAQIGFFSPELATQYREKLNIAEVICTGYTAGLGLFTPPSWEEVGKAKDWLAKFGFNNPERSFESLSATERRLVLIARAAIRPPKALILDEPTQGMDADFRDRLFGLLEFLSKETTIILVTHYDEEWPHCMTHLLRMPKFSL